MSRGWLLLAVALVAYEIDTAPRDGTTVRIMSDKWGLDEPACWITLPTADLQVTQVNGENGGWLSDRGLLVMESPILWRPAERGDHSPCDDKRAVPAS